MLDEAFAVVLKVGDRHDHGLALGDPHSLTRHLEMSTPPKPFDPLEEKGIEEKEKADKALWLQTSLELYRALPLRASGRALLAGEKILRGVLEGDFSACSQWDRREGVEAAVMGAVSVLSNTTTAFTIRVWADDGRKVQDLRDLWTTNMAQLAHWARDISGWPAVNEPFFGSLDTRPDAAQRILIVMVDADGLSVSL